MTSSKKKTIACPGYISDNLSKIIRVSRYLCGRNVGVDWEDLFQNVLLNIVQHPPQNDQNIPGWINTIVSNTFRKMIRSYKKRVEPLVTVEDIDLFITEICSDESVENRQLVNKCFDALPKNSKKRYVDIAYWYFVEGRTFQQISDDIGESTSTVGYRTKKIKKIFVKVIKGSGYSESQPEWREE